MTERTRPETLRVTAALLSFLLVGFLLIHVFSGDSDPEGALGASPSRSDSRWVAGVLHVHSSYSDGAGTPEDISKAAAAAGLDFVLLTDHWSLDALEKGEEGYRNGVLTLVGVEASTDAGHILGLDLPPTPMRFGRKEPDEVLDQIGWLGGFALAAHPDADREDFEWKGWNLHGYEGIEVFNAYSAYRRNGVMVSLAYFFIHPFWQTESVNWTLDFDPDLVATWDRILPERKLSAWAGVDAHGGFEIGEGRFVEWPSYERVFRMARNHLLLDEPLTGDVARDRELIYRAFQESRGYVSLNDREDGSGFRFWAEAGGGHFPIGSDLEPPEDGTPITLRATAPVADAELRLFRDGVQVAESPHGRIVFAADRDGIYRVEVRLPLRRLGGEGYEPWIVSNPITILPRARIEARIAANDLIERETIRFEAGDLASYPLKLEAERNAGCLALDLVPEGSSAFKARFALGVPPVGEPESHTSPYGRCAATDRRRVDLDGWGGLHFQARADGIYRVNVLLAGSNRDPTDGGKGWTVSFLTRRDWQDVTLPFDDFRRIRKRDGELDLASLTGIAFLFDTSNTIPGTSGQVEVREISLIPAGASWAD